MMYVSYQGWGGDAYPGETAQYENDHRPMKEPWVHDEPDYEPGSGEYNFFYGNGQLHVSPHHGHDDLSGHAGVDGNHTGPVFTGHVSVDQGRATWAVESNVSLRGVQRILQDYTNQVGWKWHGLTTIDGSTVDDSFAPKASFYFTEDQGHIFLAERPQHLAGKGKVHRIILGGTTAWVEHHLLKREGLQEWAKDAGFKLAEYPGGGDMTEMIYSPETLEQYNLGDSAAKPTPTKKEPLNAWVCRDCGGTFSNFAELAEHRKDPDVHMQHEWPHEDGKFPKIDMDATLPPHYHERFPVTMPLASYKEAARVEGFDDYAGIWGFDTDDGVRHYAAYLDGRPVGFATVRLGGSGLDDELVFVRSAIKNRGVGSALIYTIQQHFPSLITSAVSDNGRRLAEKCGFAYVRKGIMKWAAGQQPKDMLEAPVPFVYDVDKDYIAFGQPGQRTSDVLPVRGEFTPGGIIEGEYQPGGKVLLTSDTNMPYSVRHFGDLWKWSPISGHMEITSIERDLGTGNIEKLASEHKISAQDVGSYIRTLALADPAVHQAHQAIKSLGGSTHIVGGAIRDALMQKDPKDLDVLATGVPPANLEHALSQLPGKVDLTGKDFGVFRYRYKGHEVEIALPRTEKSTGDRRRDFDVAVDHRLPVESDLLRRDFTANSMAVDLDTGHLLDPHGGANDITTRRLRTTHPDSFQEDPTRLVRALVASSRHGLIPDENTRQEMKANASRLDLESRERIQAELDKLFKSDNPAGAIRLAQDTGLLHHLFPEIANNFDFDQNNPHHQYTLGEHSLNVLQNVQDASTDPDLRLAALLHDVGKPASAWRNPDTGFNHYYLGPNGEGADHAMVGADMAERRLRSLSGYQVGRIKRIRHLIEHHMFPAFSSPKSARKFIHRVGDEHANDLLTLRQADMFGKGQTPTELATKTTVDRQRGLVEQVRSAQEPTSMSALAVNGNDLLTLGIPRGPDIGRILRQLTNDVIEDPRLNDHQQLLQRAREYLEATPAP